MESGPAEVTRARGPRPTTRHDQGTESISLSPMTRPGDVPAQLLVYGFAPGAEFEGRLVGAIERIERVGRCGCSAYCS